ncbi:MAG: alpha/beta hydrolase family esterase [Solimonas sp.]
MLLPPTFQLVVPILLALALSACGSDTGPDPGLPAEAGSATPGHASPSVPASIGETVAGQGLSLVTDIGSALPQPVDDLLIGVSQLLPTGLQRGIIRLLGNNLQLVAGTAAFDATFEHHGLPRRFVVIRPEPIATGRAPVLLMFHGNGGTAENQANLAEVSQLVAEAGVWAVMPAALAGTWDDDPASPKDYDDVGFVGRVIDALGSSFPVDLSRVYAAGLSNGSFMSSRLACELSGRIAGFGIVAGTITGGLAAACTPLHPRRLMLVDGTNDPIVPYHGGRIGLRSAPQAYAFWLSIHGCDAQATVRSNLPDLVADGTTIELQSNRRCASNEELRLYTVRGGGHAWPGGWQYLPAPVIGTTSKDMNATREIWAFVRDARR